MAYAHTSPVPYHSRTFQAKHTTKRYHQLIKLISRHNCAHISPVPYPSRTYQPIQLATIRLNKQCTSHPQYLIIHELISRQLATICLDNPHHTHAHTHTHTHTLITQLATIRLQNPYPPRRNQYSFTNIHISPEPYHSRTYLEDTTCHHTPQ